jgi:signal transduction histidine kinase
MALELAEVAAGLPMAASLALAGGIASLREGRRRSALNEAMHELRRPLQVLSLALPDRLPGDLAVDSSLRLAADALERLDREVNGTSASSVTVPVSPRPLIEEAVVRWRGQAMLSGARLVFHWQAGNALVTVDPTRLARALDNLISNAIEHGGGTVTIDVRAEGFLLAVSVRDSGTRRRGDRRRGRRSRGGRRGHGLRLLDRFAREHAGSFDLRLGDDGATAILRLPLSFQEVRR